MNFLKKEEENDKIAKTPPTDRKGIINALLKSKITTDLCVFCADQEGRTPRHRPAPDRTGRERTAVACNSRRRPGPCHCRSTYKYRFPRPVRNRFYDTTDTIATRSLHSVPKRDISGFSRFPANESLGRNGLHISLLAKSSFLPPCI
jgi:hypothetical protein